LGEIEIRGFFRHYYDGFVKQQSNIFLLLVWSPLQQLKINAAKKGQCHRSASNQHKAATKRLHSKIIFSPGAV